MNDDDDKWETTIVITLLGFILFVSFIVEEGFTNTFWIILFFFGSLVFKKLWKKINNRIIQDGLNVTLRWIAGNIWRIGIIGSSIVGFFMLLSWYMDKPVLVKAGGVVSGFLLVLMGIFLALSFLYAIVSIVIDHTKKKIGRGK